MDVDRIRRCSHLLPDPGGEVVRELCDEVVRLRERHPSDRPTPEPIEEFVSWATACDQTYRCRSICYFDGRRVQCGRPRGHDVNAMEMHTWTNEQGIQEFAWTDEAAAQQGETTMGDKWQAQPNDDGTWSIYIGGDDHPFATGMTEENANRLVVFLNAVWRWEI